MSSANRSVRIALAKLRVPATRDESVCLTTSAAAYPALGSTRHVFTAGPLTFGIAICHEGWRYPETVRWCGSAGAHRAPH